MLSRITALRDCLLSVTLLVSTVVALTFTTDSEAATELKWYGHSAYRITTESGRVLLIDPWITNPTNNNGPADLAAIDKADLILITHGHLDHVGDAVQIAARTGAKLVANIELGQALVKYYGFPAAQAGWDSLMNLGGDLAFFDGDVRVSMVKAGHSSALETADGAAHAGVSVGFVISVRNGPTFYHTGDTEFFYDMSRVGKSMDAAMGAPGGIDVMMTCIGGHFTMGPKGAAYATKAVEPREVIPMHFGAMLGLPGTVEEFASNLKKLNVDTKLRQLPVGGTVLY